MNKSKIKDEYSNISINYKGIDINADLIYRKRKSITIKIKHIDKITVISPQKVSKKIIKEMLIEKGDWILEKLNDYKSGEEYYKDKNFTSGEKFFYLGKEYTLKIIESNDNITNKSKSDIYIEGNYIIFKTINKDKEYIKNNLKKWYKKESEKIVLERLAYCRDMSEIMIKLIPNSIKVKEQKKRWGTCTSKRDIYINSKISMARPEAIDYILVHEFSHLIYMNHSKEFYNLVKSIMPNYKDQETWLKENSYKLMF